MRSLGKFRILNDQKYLFLLAVPGLVLLFIFQYLPIYGVLLAFREYVPGRGVLGGKWVGLKYIKAILSQPNLLQAISNTLMYSGLRLIFAFPAPIVFALLLNELGHQGFKKTVQTISYLPYFLSWVVVAGLVIVTLSPSMGIYGKIADLLGLAKIVIITRKVPFVITVVISDIWKTVGWGSVIYLAVMAGIDPQLYDAAAIDGATRFQRTIHVTFPGLVPILVINLIFTLSALLSSNFDQIFNLMNPLVEDVSNIIDIYIYNTGILEGHFGFSTAAGLLRNTVAVLLLVAANYTIKQISEYTIW